MELNRKNTIKLVLVINSIILFYWALVNYEKLMGWGVNLISILFPIILGMSMAFIINIPMRAIEQGIFDKFNNKFIAKAKRPISFLLSIILMNLVMFMVLFIILPEMGETLVAVSNGVPAFIKRSELFLNDLLTKLPDGEVQRFFEEIQIYLTQNWKTISDQLFAFFQGFTTIIAGSIITIVTSVFSGVFTFVIAFVLAVYILLQKETLASQFKKLLYSTVKEKRADKTVYLLRLTNNAFNKFFTGQCLEALIIGVLFFVCMTVLKFPFALMSAIIIGVTALIPIFGAFIGCFVSAFFILITAADKVIPFIILFLVIQQVEGNLIYPKVVGGSVGLPAIWVLIAVSVGGSLMGVLGMIVMVPITSVIYIVLGEFANKKVKEKNIPKEKFE